MTATKKKTYATLLEERVAENVTRDLKDHVITVKHLDGMYRHWHCAHPGTSNQYFDIVTWPGSLCYTGDMGEYLFQRTTDMVAFMRCSAMSFSYAAEKCVADDGRLREWREEVFEEELETCLEYADGDDEQVAHVKERIEWIHDQIGGDDPQHESMAALYESGLVDGCDFPSCESYTYHFLWCLHAIKWFCDNVKDA